MWAHLPLLSIKKFYMWPFSFLIPKQLKYMPILHPPTLLFSIVICGPLALLLFLYSPYSLPLVSVFSYSPNSRLSIDNYLTLSSPAQLSLMSSPIIYSIDSHLQTRIYDVHGVCSSSQRKLEQLQIQSRHY